MEQLVLLFFLTLGHSEAFVSVKFLTDVAYKDAVLDMAPIYTREIRSRLECQALCAAKSSCRAFAFGGLCISKCRLYDSNMCKNPNMRTKSSQKSTVWDKVDSKANFSCQSTITFNRCLAEQSGRCGGCKREGFHGPNCEYATRGCPKRYEFHNGSCSWMTNAKINFSDVASSCSSSVAGGRFGLVRNKRSNDMLWSWGKALGLGDGVMVGVERVNDLWKRQDGRNLEEEDVYDNWWDPLQPSQSVQRAVVMDKDLNFAYNDELDYVPRSYFCQVNPENCVAFSMQINDTEDNCYNLHQQKANFSNAIAACEDENGILAKVKNLEIHEMLVDFLRENDIKESVYVGILSKEGTKYKGIYHDETPVEFELPWDDTQPDFLQESVVLINMVSGEWDDVLKKMPNGYSCEYIAKSCSEWYRYKLLEDGRYRLLPNGTTVDFDVRCDMTTGGGGWTVIQRRRGDANVAFNRSMSDYKKGFGSLDGDFWLGLDKIKLLTSQEAVHLMVKMVDADNVSSSVVYTDFRLEVAAATTDKYRLFVGGLASNATVSDGLGPLNGSFFVAYDSKDSPKCDSTAGGGWWVPTQCSTTNLNGNYPGKVDSGTEVPKTLIQWAGKPMTKVWMMVKPSRYFSL